MEPSAPPRPRAPLLAFALVAVACSSTTLGVASPPPDASLDTLSDTSATLDTTTSDTVTSDVVIVPDAAPPPDVTTSSDVSDASPSDAPPPGPIDGRWRVTTIACDGLPASAAARAYITAPNSSTFTVRGDRSTYTLTTSTCVMRLDSAVTYPSMWHATFTAMGPFTCTPARCSTACGTTPAIPYQYEYTRRSDTALVMSTVDETPDVTCTAYGQINPITYTYEAF
jgi:hypothetical protein